MGILLNTPTNRSIPNPDRMRHPRISIGRFLCLVSFSASLPSSTVRSPQKYATTLKIAKDC